MLVYAAAGENDAAVRASKLDYYIGFNRWKSAAIVHGVYARYMAGQKSTEGIDLEGLRSSIDRSLTLSMEAVQRLS